MNRVYVATDPLILYRASGNDLDMFRTLSRMFLDSAPALVDRMRQAGDADAFTIASHSLRGMAALIGAHDLGRVLAGLEDDARNAIWTGVPALTPACVQLEAVSREVVRSIRDYAGAT